MQQIYCVWDRHLRKHRWFMNITNGLRTNLARQKCCQFSSATFRFRQTQIYLNLVFSHPESSSSMASPEAFRATRHCMENTDGGQTVHGDHHSPALRRLIQRDHLVEVSTKPKRSSSVSIIQQHDQLPRVRTMAWFPDSVWEDRNPKPKMLHTLGGLCTGLSLGPPVQSSHR